jgi:hypothetical protein
LKYYRILIVPLSKSDHFGRGFFMSAEPAQ